MRERQLHELGYRYTDGSLYALTLIEWGRILDADRAMYLTTRGVDAATVAAFEELRRQRAAAGQPVPSHIVIPSRDTPSQRWH